MIERKIRIGIDARPVALERPTGVGAMLQGLLRFLKKREDVEPVLFLDREPECPSALIIKDSEKIIFHGADQYDWESKTAAHIKAAGIDIYHATCNHGVPELRNCKTKTLLTVHDIIPMILPQLYFPTFRTRLFGQRKYKKAMAGSLRRADLISTVSQTTRDDVLRFFPDLRDKINVVHNGVDPAVWGERSDVATGALQKRLDIPGRYLIYAGGFDPRKNVELVLRSFAEILREDSKSDLTLVLTGEKNYYFPKLAVIADNIGIGGSVRFTGYLASSEMLALVSGAAGMVNLSMYEGFGLPVLEAMVSGVPCVLSACPAFKELAGEAALFVENISDYKEAAAQMKLAIAGPERGRIVSGGRVRAKAFTEEKQMQGYMELYRILAGEL